ncbi:hypothetical protein [Mesorhizobium sp. STM 4661]|nr:hypothetical protein [Mesorhizobium sp. STM 4661]CCV12854.1 exported hypothetical protein [Mesorhizobium sp. STM 4661]
MANTPEALAHGVATALTGGTLMLALALILILALAAAPVRTRKPA